MSFHNNNKYTWYKKKKKRPWSTAQQYLIDFFLNNLTDDKFFKLFYPKGKYKFKINCNAVFLGNLFQFMHIELVIEYRQRLTTIVANKEIQNIQTTPYFGEITFK